MITNLLTPQIMENFKRLSQVLCDLETKDLTQVWTVLTDIVNKQDGNNRDKKLRKMPLWSDVNVRDLFVDLTLDCFNELSNRNYFD